MLSRFLISLLIGASIATASTTGTAVVHTQPNHVPTRAPTAQNIPAGSHFSRNWSGYVARGDTYTGVGATWTVPTVTATQQDAADATWVGIGGSVSDDLIQTGTQAIVQNGRVEYQAWVETLPDYLQELPIAVHAGDVVTVSLQEVSTNQWLLTFINKTTDTTYRHTYEYASAHSSAEWVQEMPMYGTGDLIPLDEFGSVSFSDAFATVDNKNQTPEQLNARPVTLLSDDGQILATPSSLSVDTFSVARTSTPVSDVATTPSRHTIVIIQLVPSDQ